MRAAALNEGDVGQAPLAEPIAETGDKLKARRAAADDDDSMRRIVAGLRRHENPKPPPATPGLSKSETFSPSDISDVQAHG